MSPKIFDIRRLDIAVNDRIGFYPLYLEDRECGEQEKEGLSRLRDFRKSVSVHDLRAYESRMHALSGFH